MQLAEVETTRALLHLIAADGDPERRAELMEAGTLAARRAHDLDALALWPLQIAVQGFGARIPADMFRRALDATPTPPPRAWLAYARTLRQSDDDCSQAEREAMRHAADPDSPYADLFLEQGFCEWRSGNRREALAVLDRGRKALPDSTALVLTYASALRQQGRCGESNVVLDAALRHGRAHRSTAAVAKLREQRCPPGAANRDTRSTKER